ncbi:MAG: response regulator [Phycisphaerales bacterium]|nr:response regulator [Phycisphaerales bacterium]
MESIEKQARSFLPIEQCGVLVADDEPAIRECLQVGLAREGFSVWLAADGQEALEVFRAHSDAIDVLLLDVRMPHLDGPATLAGLQQLSPQVPCCFMSGHLGSHTANELLRSGAHALLPKPFHLSEVVQLLRAATRGNHCSAACVPRSAAAFAPAWTQDHGVLFA